MGVRGLRVAATALLLALAACGTAEPERAATTELRWERLPDPPLTPREFGPLHWTGRELLVLGGDTVPPCPPAASCATPPRPQRDGAAYDPSTNTWRRTADAPLPLQGHQVLDGDVVWAQTSWHGDAPLLSYDASKDRWTQHPPPPGLALAAYVLTVADGHPVALRTEQRTQHYPDAIYDPARRSWTNLPADPLSPSFDRAAIETPQGLLVTGAKAVENPGSEKPAFLRAELLDPTTRTWKRLPASDQLVGAGIALHGTRAIWPDLGGANGGDVNGYGRTIPFGGVLDLATARWERLPDPPAEGHGRWAPFALGGPVSAAEGFLYDDRYDDRTRTWTAVPRPEDGPADPGSAAWVGDDLVVVGGTTDPSTTFERVQGAWVLRNADSASASGSSSSRRPGSSTSS